MANSLSTHTYSFPFPTFSSTPQQPLGCSPCWIWIILLNCSRPNMAAGHTAPSSIRIHDTRGIGHEPHAFPSPSNVTLCRGPLSVLYQYGFNFRTHIKVVSVSVRIRDRQAWTSVKLSTSTADTDRHFLFGTTDQCGSRLPVYPGFRKFRDSL
jgi:hypothetical protein